MTDLSNGARLGAYEILGPLGAGGMGEVYRARDARLGRDVAIKVLPAPIRADVDALARFEREAKAVAALSHPNILAIHDFGTDGGTAYAVMELLDGSTLRDALADGPLPPRKAIEYARQAARGLGAAHDRGIVHRDVKPENLFVTRDGRIKILDFGLARPTDQPGPAAREDTPTFTHLTGPGAVLGTVNYMSPEQARGEPAGPASDIFSLGTVLFEMLSGERPFARETAPETMTAILREDPPAIDPEGPGATPALQRIVQRCLEKRPGERFQSAHDLAFALETSAGTSGGPHAPVAGPARPARSARRFGVLTVVAAAVIGAVVGVAFWALLRPVAEHRPVKVSTVAFSGIAANPAASPDGRTIAFAARRGGIEGIWLKRLDGGGEAPLTRGYDVFPRFSPDGSTVLFARREDDRASLRTVPVIGGSPRTLVDDATQGDWSPDGTRVLFLRQSPQADSLGIIRVDGSGERIVLVGQNEVVTSPRWSPDGRHVAFVTVARNNTLPLSIRLLDLESGEVRDLPPKRPSVTGVAWSGSGDDLVFGWSEDLLAGTASTASRVSTMNVATGRTRDLFWTDHLMLNSFGTALDVAGPGRMVFGTVGANQGLREEPEGPGGTGAARVLTDGNSVDRQPVYAPDGASILFSSNRSGNLDLWSIDLSSGATRQLTDDEARDWDPAFVGDGSRIVWSSDRGGNLEIWTANADGSGARQVSRDGLDAENPTTSPDGDWVVYVTSNPGKRGLWKVRLDGTEASRIWEGSSFIPGLSPDGRYVAFVVQDGVNSNALQALELATGDVTVVAAGLSRGQSFPAGNTGRSRWSTDGRTISFLCKSGENLGVMRQDFVPGRDSSDTRRRVAGFDPEWSTESFDVAPDGARIVLSRFRPQGSVLIAEGVPSITRARPD